MKMKRLGIALLVTTLWLTSAGLGSAQRTETTYRFSATGTNGLGQLSQLQHAAVQKELQLNNQQLGRIAELLKDQEQWAKKSQNDGAQNEARAAELDKAVSGFLTGPQVKRLKEIALQQQGAWALADSKIADALELTADQKDKVRSITTDARFKMRGLAGRGRAPSRGNADAARKEAGEKLLAVLTEAQLAKWKELLGKPFEGKSERP
jgi:hypothetical protein